MVEVFKTNVRQRRQAARILTVLTRQFPGYQLHFDLEDCDRILRVEGQEVPPEPIMELVRQKGYLCQVLE
ncbi:hypothetical protein GCM10027275_54850 [Rhabdobacter roseus]|uniref:Uncharacterized protein n=1 Tax=Rhabdobacter roseus TaxID=1655419 RepID=A0A840U609_9BACT|nr:hypothetical protein [Rhabdobacter roseus]MBB5287500.1 hypothetical protein [Rhabdobacter roseus]